MYNFIICLLLAINLSAQNSIVIQNLTTCPYTITVYNQDGNRNYFNILESYYQVTLKFLDGYTEHYVQLETINYCLPICNSQFVLDDDLNEVAIFRSVGKNGDIFQRFKMYSNFVYILKPPRCIKT